MIAERESRVVVNLQERDGGGGGGVEAQQKHRVSLGPCRTIEAAPMHAITTDGLRWGGLDGRGGKGQPCQARAAAR